MTDKLREAAQLAIDALEEGHSVSLGEFGDTPHAEQFTTAITALRAALAQQDAQAVPQGHNLIDADELRHIMRDAERYRFIRDAGRSECISYEIRTYAMETLDGYVDAAIEDEAAMQEKQS